MPSLSLSVTNPCHVSSPSSPSVPLSLSHHFFPRQFSDFLQFCRVLLSPLPISPFIALLYFAYHFHVVPLMSSSPYIPLLILRRLVLLILQCLLILLSPYFTCQTARGSNYVCWISTSFLVSLPSLLWSLSILISLIRFPCDLGYERNPLLGLMTLMLNVTCVSPSSILRNIINTVSELGWDNSGCMVGYIRHSLEDSQGGL